MNAQYVCIRCRPLLACSSLQVRRAGFVSLGRLVENEHTELAPQHDRKESGERKLGKPTQYRQRRDDKLLEDLFTSSRRRTQFSSRGDVAENDGNARSVHDVPARQLIDEQIATLKHRMHVQKVPIPELWKDFRQLVGSTAWQLMQSEAGGREEVVCSAEQLDVFRDILLQVACVRSPESHRQAIPSITKAIKLYQEQGLMRNWFDQILWKFISRYLRLSPDFFRNHRKASAAANGVANHVLMEIVQIWQMLTDESAGPSTMSSNIGPDSTARKRRWSALRAIDRESESLPSNISERLPECWHRHRSTSQGNTGLTVATIMTVDILSRMKKTDPSYFLTRLDAEPLLEFLSRLIQGGSIQRSIIMDSMQRESIPRPVAEEIIRKWQTINVTVVENPAIANVLTEGQAVAKERKISFAPPPGCSSELRRATQNADSVQITNLWREFQEQVHSKSLEEGTCNELFAQFISAFFTARRQSDAVEVWNFMVSTGHQPTLSHWNSMLKGCTNARDITSLREVWNNMHSARIKPDISTWSIWIQGLMACKALRQGLQALDDLGKIWKSEKTIDYGLLPTIAPVQAALNGLAARDNMRLADTVLAWAKTHSIRLDTQTYNIILRPAVRSNDQDKVQSILNEMSTKNCHPDIATFTIMLNGLLSNPSSTFHSQSPAQQQAAVLSILRDVEQHGLKASKYTYSTILDGLLDPKVSNIPAAHAVLQHMAQNRIRASPHVYTILVTHYFSLSPPDLPAIDSLLRRIQLEGTPLDPVFYDRMIEQYAWVGETEKMLLMLRRMPEQGKSPGWMALLACLRALVEAREWESVADLVRDVEREGGLLRHGNGPWRGKDDFWELVQEVKHEAGL
ncbi:MAG: hypothetical protein Q9191_006551 [Dirinaria sp. TL-2023a]